VRTRAEKSPVVFMMRSLQGVKGLRVSSGHRDLLFWIGFFHGTLFSAARFSGRSQGRTIGIGYS